MKDDLLNRKRVLIVEDEAIIAMCIADTLKSMGCNVIGTTGLGEKAIELAELLLPDLVLMDIRLNGVLDGITAARMILEKVDTQVVFSSAHLNVSKLYDKQLSARCSAIRKPIQEAELIAVCSESLSS